MKKHISFSLILVSTLLTLSSFAQQSFTVSGKWEREEKTPRIVLYEVISGRLRYVDTARIQDDKSFTINHVSSKEGFFVIGTGQAVMKQNNYTFYFKPGDALNVVVNDSSYTLAGENTKENLAMEAWHNFVFPLERYGIYPSTMTFVEFFPMVENITTQANTYSPLATENPVFNENFAKYRKFDMLDDALMFFRRVRSAQPENKDFPNYYRNLKTSDLLTNTDVLFYPYSNFVLTNAMMNDNRFSGKQDAMNAERLLELATNAELKGELVLNDILSQVSELWQLERFDAKYGQMIITEAQKQRYESGKERVARQHKAQRIGEPGLAWTYKDPKGNDVSFSDFKGKIVYLDVWATWCGFCRKEFPDLKKTEEHFAGNKDIVFLGVSIDAPKDVQKWKDMIVAQSLPGVQVHSGNGDDGLNKLYNIRGIPRFLLFDKEGNIFSANAPRPSSPDLIPLLEELLKN